MLADALRYPIAGRPGRDALAACTGLVLVGLLLFRVAGALWPAPVALVPAALAALPALLFAGYLGAVLRDSGDQPPRFQWSGATLLTGLRVLGVAGAYLAVPVIMLLGSVAALLSAGTARAAGPLLVVAPTLALLALVAFTYLLPGGVAAAVHAGVRTGLSRRSLAGLASGSYFFAWTVGAVAVVVAWGLVWTASVRSPLAVPGSALVAYGHLVAARLAAQGLARSRWTPPTAGGQS